MLNIDISVAEAQARVKGLKGSILELADAAERAATDVGQSFDQAFVAKELKALRGKLFTFNKQLNETELGVLEARKELVEFNATTKRTAKVLEEVSSGEQKYNRLMKEATVLADKNRISQDDLARATEVYRKVLDKTGTDAELFIRKLQAQNAAFGKSDAALMRQLNGWKLLDPAMRQTADAALKFNNVITKIGPAMKLTPMEKLIERLRYLKIALDQEIIVHAEYVAAVGRTRAAIDKLTSAEEKRNAVKQKKPDTEAASYISKLEQTTIALGKTGSEALQLSNIWEKLNDSQRHAATSMLDLQASMRRLGEIAKADLTPLDQLRQRIEDINRARAMNVANPQMGVTAASAIHLRAGAEKEFEKNTRAAIQHGKAMRDLAGDYHIANQATAAFRAGMQGVGLGFGMFTSATILAATAVYGITRALKESLKVGASFEFTFDRAAVMMGQFGAAADKTNPKFAELRDMVELVENKVLELGETTQFTSNEVAKAAQVLAAAGLEPIEVYSALAGTLNLAAIGAVDTARAADIAVTTMYSFGKSAANLDGIVDVLAKTVVATNLSIDQVANTLQYVGATANVTGLELEDVAALMGVLGNAGIKASMAGTALRRVLTNIYAPTEKVSAAFKALKIDVGALTKGVDVAQGVQRVFEALDKAGVGSAESLKYLKDITGQWALSAGASLVNMSEKIGEFRAQLLAAKGTAEAMRKELQQNLTGAMETLGSVLENIGVRAFIGDKGYGADLTADIRTLTELIKANGPAISEFLADTYKKLMSLGRAIAAIAEPITVLGAVYTAFRVLSAMIGWTIGITERYTLAVGALTASKLLQAEATHLATTANALDTASMVAAGAAANKLALGTAAAGTSMAINAGRVGLMARGLAGLTALLGGVPGVIATVVIGGLYLLNKTLKDTTVQTFHASEALSEYEKVVKHFAKLAPSALSSLSTRLSADVAASRKNIADLKKQSDEFLKTALEASKKAKAMDGGLSQGRFGGDSQAVVQAEADAAMKGYAKSVAETNAALKEQNRLLAAHVDTILQDAAAQIASTAGARDYLVTLSMVNANLGPMLTSLAGLNPNLLSLAKTLDTTALATFGLGGAFSAVFKTATSAVGGLRSIEERIRAIFKAQDAAAKEAKAASALAEAESAAKTARDAQTNALVKYIEEYEKLTGSYAGTKRELAEVQQAMKDLEAGAAGSTAALKKMGYTAEQAQEALKSKEKDLFIERVQEELAKVDPRFKELKKTLAGVTEKELDTAAAMAMTEKVLRDSGASAEMTAEVMKVLGGSLGTVATGAAEANKKMEDFLRKTNEDWAAFIGTESIGTIAESLGTTANALEPLQREGIATNMIMKALGGTLDETRTEADRLAQFVDLLTIKFGKNWHEVDLARRMYKQFAESLPTGALEKQNRNLATQNVMMLAGGDALELYNMQYAAFGENLHNVTDEFNAAALAQIRLKEEMEQMEAVQQAFETFADGVAKTFSEIFDSGVKSFDDFADKIKDLFKQLLADLAYQAIKNSIVFAMTGQGPEGNSRGFWQSMGQGFSQMFGGRNAVAATQPQTGWAGQIGGYASQLFGGGGGNAFVGPPEDTMGPPEATDFSALVSNAIQRATGVSAGSAGNAAAYGGFTPQQILSIGSSLASVGTPVLGFQAAAAPATLGGYGGLGIGTGSYIPAGAGVPSYLAPAGGTAAPVAGGSLMGGIAGAAYGYSTYGAGGMSGSSLAAGASYGIAAYYGLGALSAGLAAGSAALAGGATMMGAGGALATAGSAGMGVLGAMGPVGWAALALVAINAISGGKLFGTRKKPQDVTTTFGVGAEGGTTSTVLRSTRQRSLFRGRQTIYDTQDSTPEQISQANELYKTVRTAADAAARALGVDFPELLEGTFTAITDTKGNIKEEYSTVRGVRYDEDLEAFSKRIMAENIIEVVARSLGETLGEGGAGGGGGIGGGGGGGERLDAMRKLDPVMGEVDALANRWRSNADDLLAGAKLMLLAQSAIKEGDGLLQEVGAGVLTRTVDLVEELAYGSEDLEVAYQRLVDSTKVMEDSLGGFGIAAGRTREEFIRFSAAAVESMGGLEKAREKLGLFMEYFKNFEGFNAVTAAANRDKRATLMEQIGLDPSTSAADFMQAFTEALPTIKPEDLGTWIDAGNAVGVVHNALEAMRETAYNTGESLVDQVDKQIAAIDALGASEEELAEARRLGTMILQRALEEFMFGIEGQLAPFENRGYLRQIEEITRAMNDNLKTARNLGGQERDLARIRALAAHQIQAVIAELRASIGSLAEQLYGDPAATELQNSIDGATQAAMREELAASEELHESEMERYEASQEAIKSIAEFLQQLSIGDLSPESWEKRLGSARTHFGSVLGRAQAGDTEALGEITGAAQEYLNLASEFFGSTTEYADIYAFVTGALRGLSGVLGQVARPADLAGGGSSEFDSGSSGSGAAVSTEMKPAERFKLALQLAQEIGQLGLALDVSVFDLLEEMDIGFEELARDFGININNLDKNAVSNIALLAASLKISTLEVINKLGVTGEAIANAFGFVIGEYSLENVALLTQISTTLGVTIFEAITLLGVDIKELALSFGIDAANIVSGTTAAIASLATTLGTSAMSIIEALGIDLQTLATSFGVSTASLSGDFYGYFTEFANLLGLDIVAMADALGVTTAVLTEGIVGAITAGLETLPGIPQTIKDELGPFLTAILNADDSTGVRTAILGLYTYIATLPAAQYAVIKPFLDSLGLSITEGDNGSGAVVEALSAFQTESLTVAKDTKTAIIENKDFTNDVKGYTLSLLNVAGNSYERLGGIIGALNGTNTLLSAMSNLPMPVSEYVDPGDTPTPIGGGGLPIGGEGGGTSAQGYFDTAAKSAKTTQAETLVAQQEAVESSTEIVIRLEAMTQVIDTKLSAVVDEQTVTNDYMSKTARKRPPIIRKARTL